MRRLISFLAFYSVLYAPVYAFDYVVHVPDELTKEGEGWQHFTRAEEKEKAQLFLDRCVFDPANNWVLDYAVFVKTWGRVKTYKESGITVEVKK